MVKKVDHIGIAVKNLEETLKFYEGALGLKCGGTEVVEEQKVKVAFLPIGDTEIELLESTTLFFKESSRLSKSMTYACC